MSSHSPGQSAFCWLVNSAVSCASSNEIWQHSRLNYKPAKAKVNSILISSKQAAASDMFYR